MKATRILSALLAAVMLLSICVTGVYAAEKLPFTDVKKNWSYEPIKYVYETGLMNGTGDGTTFSPNMNLSRGMVVTVLYRNDGSPEMEYDKVLVDVPEGKYYSIPAVWAYKNGIVTGTGEDEWGEPIFSADRDITRQELATMFARYASYKYVDTAQNNADIASFPDNGKVAKWASAATKWAVGTGLITGKGTGDSALLAPTDKASRAEYATIIKRFNESTDKFSYLLAYEKPVLKSSYTEKEYPLVTDADIYVAVDGNDSNPGTLEKPLATFEAAKAKVKSLKESGKKNITVAFKAGDYGILDNSTFTADNAGGADGEVTYCAYGDGPVYFTNGVFITPEEFKPLDESDKALFNPEFADDIKKIDLSDNAHADKIGSSTTLSNDSGFCWQARVPNKEKGVDKYYPGFSYFALLPDSPLTYEELIYHTDNGFTAEETDAHLYQDRFFVTRVLKEKLDSYDSYDNVQLCGYISKVWHQDIFTITSYDKETGLVIYDGRPPWGFYARVGQQTQIYVNNASRELDDIGEFFVDPETKILYVYKPQGAYTISLMDRFATLEKGADNITFKKLNFRCCKGIAMVVDADDFTMDQCSIMYVGGSNAFHSEGTLNIKITNSTFAYCAESGVYVRGPRHGRREGYDYYALNNTGFVFENNLIHDVDMASVPVESGGLSYGYQIGAVIAHNEIYNSARYGIDFKYGNIDCIMEYNYLHHCMQNSADGGAFYCGRVATNRGNTIRYNLISNIQPKNAMHTGGTFAIYLDDSHENLVCYGNVFYNSGSIMNNGGRSHEIYDNVFIKEGSGIAGRAGHFSDITLYADPEADSNYYSEGWNSLTLIPDEATPNGQKWKAKWPELYDIVAIRNDPTCYKDTDLYTSPLNYCHNNYHFDGASSSFEEKWIELSDHENNVEFEELVNPIFTDPTHGDYSIRDGAEFMDNHYEKIGRY